MLKKSGVDSSFRVWFGDPTLLSCLILTNSPVTDPQSYSVVIPKRARAGKEKLLLEHRSLCFSWCFSALFTWPRTKFSTNGPQEVLNEWSHASCQSSLASEIIGTITRSWSFTCPSQLGFTLMKYTEAFHTCCHLRVLQNRLIWCCFRHPRTSGESLDFSQLAEHPQILLS